MPFAHSVRMRAHYASRHERRRRRHLRRYRPSLRMMPLRPAPCCYDSATAWPRSGKASSHGSRRLLRKFLELALTMMFPPASSASVDACTTPAPEFTLSWPGARRMRSAFLKHSTSSRRLPKGSSLASYCLCAGGSIQTTARDLSRAAHAKSYPPYFTTAVNTSSIANPLPQPVMGACCCRLSVQMGWETPPKEARPS